VKLVILDRDGVINQDSDAYIKTPDEWQPLPGSLEAIARLTHAGYRVAVATNQAGIARGLFDLDALNQIHTKMTSMVHEAGGHLDLILFCPHADDRAPCRKPNPGMYREIAERLRVSLRDVPAIGDTLNDIETAQAVSARPILVRTGKGLRTLASGDPPGVVVYDDLAAAVSALLAEDPVEAAAR
jgi:D-glycero-D-manno-heptose 1,7-bisphosphate phosphatase